MVKILKLTLFTLISLALYLVPMAILNNHNLVLLLPVWTFVLITSLLSLTDEKLRNTAYVWYLVVGVLAFLLFKISLIVAVSVYVTIFLVLMLVKPIAEYGLDT